MDKTKSTIHARYYHVTIGSTTSARLLTTNTERAFIIAQLQDVLGTRSLLEEPTAYRRLASYIDLLAFSLLPHSIQLVVFAISFESASLLAALLMDRLDTFASIHSPHTVQHRHSITQVRPLLGPYEALDTSTHLHLAHKDWEYDRYSSIGFYLHDRRGGLDAPMARGPVIR